MAKKIYAYSRFSDASQSLGTSKDRQEEFLQNFAKAKKLPIVESDRYHDAGVSGYKQHNLKGDAALKRFLDLLEKKKIPRGSYLVVESMDRLSRADIMTVNQLLTNIINSGIILVTSVGGAVKEFDKSSIDNQPLELIVLLLDAQRGNKESKRKQEMLQKYWELKRNSSEVFKMKCPWWIRWNEKLGRYEAIEDRARIVRRIYSLYASGLGHTSIIKTLNREKVPPIRGKNWGSYVAKLLKFRAVIGELQLTEHIDGGISETVIKKNFYPPIIKMDVWNKVSKLRKFRSISVKSAIAASSGKNRIVGMKFMKSANMLFTNMLVCGYCGRNIYFKYGVKKLVNGTVAKHKYLICSGLRSGLKCISKPWRYDDFENVFLKFAREITISHADTVAEDSKLEELQNDNERIEKKIFNVSNAIAAVEDASSIKVLSKTLDSLNRHKNTNQERIEQLQSIIAEKHKMNTSGLKSLDHLAKRSSDASVRIQVAEQLRIYFDQIRLFSVGSADEPNRKSKFYVARLRGDSHDRPERFVKPNADNPKLGPIVVEVRGVTKPTVSVYEE